TLDLVILQRPRELQRRELRRVQDLIGVRVADPAEEMGIGQRSLQRVVLTRERVAKPIERGVERLETAGIERRQRRLTSHELNGRALLRACLGEEQRAV